LKTSQSQTKVLKTSKKIIKEDQQSIKAEQKKNAYVLNLVEQFLHGLEVDIKAFNEAVKGASSVARSEIFSRADDNRRENWKSNQEHMERSLPLLYALTATDEVEICHWWYGALAYCLKDKRTPDYEMALRYLNKAIAVRGDNVRSGAYEFNRAICRINLVAMNPTKEWDTEIRRDIDAARRFPKFAGIINDNRTIQDWLQKTEAQPAAVKVNFGS
jgi:hypothetical protein